MTGPLWDLWMAATLHGKVLSNIPPYLTMGASCIQAEQLVQSMDLQQKEKYQKHTVKLLT